jgi:hypothetical protein
MGKFTSLGENAHDPAAVGVPFSIGLKSQTTMCWPAFWISSIINGRVDLADPPDRQV